MIHRTFYPFLAFALILSLAVTFLTAQPQAARASSIIFVDVDATSGANNGSSWTDAYTNLQSALAPALPGDEIWVAEGTYKPGASSTDTFTLKSGVALYGGFAGNEAVRSQRDWAAHPTVLSGDIDLAGSNDSYHIVTGSGTDTTAILDGFTVSGGNADGSSPDDSGGGMYNDGGDPTLRNITFSNNFATYGGGVYNTASNPSLVNVVFIANMAVDGSGIYNTSSNPTIVNTTFYDNSATNLGSAIGNWNNSNPTLSNSILWGNSVPSVHQIYSDNSTPTVRYSDIQGGFAGPGNISSNPQFVDAPNGDLRLKNTSAAIDAGDNTALPTDTDDLDGDDDTAERIPFDLVGSPRFVNHSRADTGLGYSPIVDMGAYENQTANTAPALDNSGSPTLVAIDEDDANIAGTLVSTIIASGAGGNPITDPDSGALEGLAVIGVDNTSGVWQYSVDGGSSSTSVRCPTPRRCSWPIAPTTGYASFQPPTTMER